MKPPIIKKIKAPKKSMNTRNKMEGLMYKKTNKPPQRVDDKGNIKFLKPLQSQEADQIRKQEILLKGHLA
jgi:hypothetical protein